MSKPRLIILANRDKPLVNAALSDDFRPWLADRAEIVAEPDISTLDDATVKQLPGADLAMVLGGDGTFLAQARRLVDLGIPMLGINFGKLGFLAEFSLEEVKQHWEAITGGRCHTTQRLLINVYVLSAGALPWGGGGELPEPRFAAVAMNDAVITAGPPFRMIELELAIDPQLGDTSATVVAADGAVVSTPSGSTAYNLANGGPIISPGVIALSVTAICPHTLAFRPIVVDAQCDVWLRVLRANDGTTLVIDGQESIHLMEGEQVLVRRHDKMLTLVHNPNLSYWKMLAHKMRWAAGPRRG